MGANRNFSWIFPILLLTAVVFIPMQPATRATPLNQSRLYLPLVTNHFDSGLTWLEPFTLAADPAPNSSSNQLLAIDRQGQVHFLWDTFSSPRFIYHAVLADETWSDPAPVASTLGTSYALFPPAVDRDGHLHLAWRNWLGSGVENEDRILYASYARGSWGAEEELLRDTYEARAILQLAADGWPHVVTQDTIFGSRLFHIQETPAGWQAPLRITPDHTVSAAWPDASSGVRLYGDYYYQDWSHYSYWDGQEIALHRQTSGGKVSSHRTQLDGQDNLHVFRTGQVPVPGGHVNGLYYQCLDRDLNWGPQQVLSGQLRVGGEVRAASDGASRVALSWKQADENRLWIVIFDGCTPFAEKVVTPPFEKDWDLRAVAISAEPRQICVLARQLWTAQYTLWCARLAY